jgi:hypothetical protein
MSDYSDLINQSFGSANPALPTTVGNIDEDPDKAQRALDLSKATGVPSTAIFGDLEEFERQHKAVMASDIVANNPHLSDFVQSNPMVPKIANDDYGNLDSVSQKVSTLGLLSRAHQALDLSHYAFPKGTDPLARFKGGGPIGDTGASLDELRNHPFRSAVMASIATPFDLALRGLSGAFETGADVAHNIGAAIGGESFGRELGAVVETEAMGLSGSHAVHGPTDAPGPKSDVQTSPLLSPKDADTVRRGLMYATNLREPPPGLLPDYDDYRAKQNADDLNLLKDATSDAQTSLTRERSPELFHQFIAQHTDAEIGIGGDAAAALYGDKVPTADDGLLGWVPGIESKLNLARASGDDISIPLADWLTNVEPEVMQALHDDIRVRPGGITVNEAKLAGEVDAVQPPAEPLPAEVPSTRAASALEPLYSIGDRKLKLERLAGAEGSMFGPEAGFHDFSLNDEQGRPIGTLNLSEQNGGKQLYVEMINGINGLGPRDFGPALMRDLLRQVKEQFPNAESITGHRVSGAREKAGVEMTAAAPVVKLDRLDDEGFRNILEGGQWETYSPNTQAYIKPDAIRPELQRQLVNTVNAELDRIVPKKVAIQGADTIKVDASGIAGQRAGEDIKVGGTYIRYKDTYPIILYALDSGDALGTARHEAIHHLRAYGFFDKNEWSTLENEALAGGWLRKYNIDRRYPTGGGNLKLEEAIAEAYQDWARGQDTLKDRAGEIAQVPSPLDAIFQKMKDFFDAIKEHISQLLGKDASWEDIFQKVSTGEVGGREGTEPLDARAFNEKLSVPDEPSRVFERANALGMTVDQYKRYNDLIAKRHAEDIEAATNRAQADQAKQQTKQWRDDRKALRQEVSENIRQRPDVAADLFFGNQELYGKKLDAKVKLNADDLTPEQKATLPRDYYGADGIHPDDVANLFGYGSGDAMVERLGQYNAAKLAANMSAKDFVSRVTDIETDRQMHMQHGVLEDNIMDAVKEQVVGETQIDMLAEETHALGMKVGQAPLDKATIVGAVRQEFAKTTLGAVSSDRYLAAAGRAGRQAEMALLQNDPATAFQAKQRQWYATILAREAVQTEKAIAGFDKIAKRFNKREVASVDQEYTNFIHDILLRVGRPVRRSVQDLQTEIAAGEYKSLADFVEGKQSFYLREVAVADILQDPAFRKKFEDLTVDEFNATNMSVKSLLANGRDEKKITKAGVAEDLDVVRGQMIDQLREFQEKTYDAKGGRWMGPIPPKLAKILRTFGTAHIQMENLFNRWDHDNPNGTFQQYVMRDLVDASNNESVMEKRYAARLRDLDDKADLKKSIDNTLFKVPNSDQLMKLNRGNLRTILLNAGNESNLAKLAKGYGIHGEQVLAWLGQHATKEDWDWAQGMGNIFKELKGEADVMYRNLSGVAPESLAIKPIDTPHGQYEGWYYPVIYHPEFEGTSRKLMGKDALEQEGFVRATTGNGYTQKRTGYSAPMALDLDMLPARMKQMIHDVAMRPSVINASKIFYDKDIRATIGKHFGNEWRDMLVPYLVDVANSANYMPKQQRIFADASEFIRQNMVSTLVGLNPSTVLKHGPTALAQSLHEVGPINFLRAMKGLFSINERTGESNWQFAMRESEELQRRHQNYVETLGGSTAMLQPKDGYAALRNTIQRLSASPVAISDLLSAVPTWLAQYEKSMADNGGIHGDAVYDANRSVRRAHGSVAITNRSAVMRGGAATQWLSSVYGFFNHIMNRQYELLWKSGEAVGDAKSGNYHEAMQKAPELTSMLFAYVLAPALIEELVTPLVSSDNESWGRKAAKGVAFTLGASWVGVRDIANAILNGRDPSVGLVSTALKTITDPFRDLNKQAPFSKEHAGKIVKDGATLLGTLTGVVPSQVGRTAEFGHGVASGQERPRGPWGWLTGARYGTLKGHPTTLNEWQRHHLGGR